MLKTLMMTSLIAAVSLSSLSLTAAKADMMDHHMMMKKQMMMKRHMMMKHRMMMKHHMMMHHDM
jgi:hypothetical protein